MDIKKLGRVLITGGTGFIGSYLTKRLVNIGIFVRVFDNNSRGNPARLGDYLDRIEYIKGDVTNFKEIHKACKDIDTIFHLAFINGTENFYKIPGKVLEVGVKGAINTLEAAAKCKVSNYLTVSSSEVYQEPLHIPTPETERIIIPDIKNPRFSYSGGKILAELLSIHYTKGSGMKIVICRPHNFYGPDMGLGHVIPQFIVRMKTLTKNFILKKIDFPIQGTGREKRSFCYIDDAIEGMLFCIMRGENREIYHIGTSEEVTIADLAAKIADLTGVRIRIKSGELLTGGAKRRCPDIGKIKKLGYSPKVSLSKGLKKTVNWYINGANLKTTISSNGV